MTVNISQQPTQQLPCAFHQDVKDAVGEIRKEIKSHEDAAGHAVMLSRVQNLDEVVAKIDVSIARVYSRLDTIQGLVTEAALNRWPKSASASLAIVAGLLGTVTGILIDILVRK